MVTDDRSDGIKIDVMYIQKSLKEQNKITFMSSFMLSELLITQPMGE